MATNGGINWDGFKDRAAAIPQGANLEAQLRESIVRVNAGKAAGRKPRTPAAAIEAPGVADLLLAAIRTAAARSGKVSREAAIREAALLEALAAVIGGGQ